jgi:hypothetical protein
MESDSDSDFYTEININDIIDKYSWKYLRVEPYPFSKIELDKSYFKNKNICLFEKCDGPPLSKSGDSSTCHFGKIKKRKKHKYDKYYDEIIDEKTVYFYIMDDPGYSGYSCCGDIVLYYSDSINIVKENMKTNN